MSDTPIQLIIVAFKDEKSAGEALKTLKQAKKKKLIKIENAAVLHKDEKGKLHIRETADLGGKQGAALGGVVPGRSEGLVGQQRKGAGGVGADVDVAVRQKRNERTRRLCASDMSVR